MDKSEKMVENHNQLTPAMDAQERFLPFNASMLLKQSYC